MNKQDADQITLFDSNTTIRWSCRKGDFLAWLRSKNPFADGKHSVDMLDVWEMRSGDFVTITNRMDDLPSWFELHPTEVCNRLVYSMMEKLKKGYRPGEILDGPNLWRIRAGDRLAWIGDPRNGLQSRGNVLVVLDFLESALAIGETNRKQTIEEAISFGALTPQGERPESVAKVREAVLIIRDLGIPRTIATDWQLG